MATVLLFLGFPFFGVVAFFFFGPIVVELVVGKERNLEAKTLEVLTLF